MWKSQNLHKTKPKLHEWTRSEVNFIHIIGRKSISYENRGPRREQPRREETARLHHCQAPTKLWRLLTSDCTPCPRANALRVLLESTEQVYSLKNTLNTLAGTLLRLLSLPNDSILRLAAKSTRTFECLGGCSPARQDASPLPALLWRRDVRDKTRGGTWHNPE